MVLVDVHFVSDTKKEGEILDLVEFYKENHSLSWESTYEL